MSRPRVVYRFPFEGRGSVEVPFAFVKPVHFQPQGVDLCLWAEVNPQVPDETTPAIYRIHGTGASIPDGERHVASCQDGSYVWHLYMVQSPSQGVP